jgi:Protein of unknown function (DUF2510)
MSTPAGWYPQPDGQQRYWDGEQWTQDFAPGVPPMAPPTGLPMAPPTGLPMAPPTGLPMAPPANTQQTPPPVTRKNWFLRHKILTGLGALLLIGIFSSLANGGNKSETSSVLATKPVATSTTPDQAAVDKAAADKVVADKVAAAKAATDKIAAAKAAAAKAAAEKAAAAQAAAGVYDQTYGRFTTVVQSGRGDALIAIPNGAKAGMVTATTNGSSNFQISGLDKGNQPTIDQLVNAIGSYSGTTAFGVMDLGNKPVKLQITADGSWTIAIAPISSARVLPSSITGHGDAVFKFDGDAADFAITHNGTSNFTVQQYGGDPSMGVNEIGKYSGTVPFVAGPTVLVIGADGTWTFTKQG